MSLLQLFSSNKNQEKKEINEETLPFDLRNPFSKNSITEIHIHMYKPNTYRFHSHITANVKFKNGNTEGIQNFESDDFLSLMKKLDNFIKSLNNQ